MRRLLFLTLAALLAPAAAGALPGKMFDDMDGNRDGLLSAAEHAAGAHAMFQQMDSNRDGRVGASEMSAAHESITGKKAAAGGPDAMQKIAVVDTDMDGSVSAAEHADGARRMFAKMDADADGTLTPAEFDAGHAGLHQPQPR